MGEGEPRIDAEGHAFLNVRFGDGRVESLAGRLDVDLDGNALSFEVGPVPRGPAPIPVAGRSREVRRFVRRWIYAMRTAATADAGRRRPITPVPKPVGTAKKKAAPAPKPPTEVSCPRCDGDGLPNCRLCEGAGTVTPAEAAAWEAEQS